MPPPAQEPNGINGKQPGRNKANSKSVMQLMKGPLAIALNNARTRLAKLTKGRANWHIGEQNWMMAKGGNDVLCANWNVLVATTGDAGLSGTVDGGHTPGHKRVGTGQRLCCTNSTTRGFALRAKSAAIVMPKCWAD